MATVSIHHGLKAGPEGLAHLADVGLGHVGPLLLHSSLQGVHAWVGSGTGLTLNKAPDPVVQWGGVQRWWGPEVSQPDLPGTTSKWPWPCGPGPCPAASNSCRLGRWHPPKASPPPPWPPGTPWHWPWGPWGTKKAVRGHDPEHHGGGFLLLPPLLGFLSKLSPASNFLLVLITVALDTPMISDTAIWAWSKSATHCLLASIFVTGWPGGVNCTLFESWQLELSEESNKTTLSLKLYIIFACKVESKFWVPTL